MTIVVYHYVRELKHSRYPEIKGLSVDLFKEQLKYITKYYTVITMEDLIVSVKSNSSLPRNALLLTFDDAYIDHYLSVFPVLDDLGIQGSFFPPAKAILESLVLDVNKIHFILASEVDKQKLVDDIFCFLDENRSDCSLKSNHAYFLELAVADRFDPAEVVFIKRILQRELPQGLRREMLDHLFAKYVNMDERTFSRELYMSIDQLKCMKRNGMYIGSHGFDHVWLDMLDKDTQKKELEFSLEFLKQLGCELVDWVMCYPYGACNDTLLSTLKAMGCRMGLGTQFGIANLDRDNLLKLPRLDTNDFPKDNHVPPPWQILST